MEVEPSPREDLLARLAPSGAEDFITEAFCWLLARTGFGDSFLDRLIQFGQGGLPAVGARCSWGTQQSIEVDGISKRPDMMCVSADEDYALIFEHKVNAALHPGQLDDYRRRLAAVAATRGVRVRQGPAPERAPADALRLAEALAAQPARLFGAP